MQFTNTKYYILLNSKGESVEFFAGDDGEPTVLVIPRLFKRAEIDRKLTSDNVTSRLISGEINLFEVITTLVPVKVEPDPPPHTPLRIKE